MDQCWTCLRPRRVLLALTACSGGNPADEVSRLDRNTEYDGEKLRLFVELDDGLRLSVNTA